MTLHLWLGDCLNRMANMEEESIESVLCDPPYGLEFMGKEWDRITTKPPNVTETLVIHDPSTIGGHQNGAGGNAFSRSRIRYGSRKPSAMQAQQAWHTQWLTQAFRVLQPGGTIKAFGGTRTFHRMAAAMEQVGFIHIHLEAWTYASGFPKSHNVAIHIDKHLGAMTHRGKAIVVAGRGSFQKGLTNPKGIDPHQPITPQAKLWNGWGTALKPAWEPVLIGTKPENP